MAEDLEIDGAQGEGGGQIIRSSLALAVITGRPVHLTKIRAGRAKPGLRRQHLTAARAAAAICDGRLRGDALGSSELWFEPGAVAPGDYRFAVGTAGSTTLVLQTVLWPLLLADGGSTVEVTGGTHNPMAPTFDFIARTFVPAVQRMGAQLEVTLPRAGFYPAGGGVLRAELVGVSSLSPLALLERGPAISTDGRAVVANLPIGIARREVNAVREALGWAPGMLDAVRVDADGPGNAVMLATVYGSGTTVFSAIGQKGKPAEKVAAEACEQARAFVGSDVPVDPHLADQLLIGLALAGGGAFRTLRPTLHTETNAAVIERFLPVRTTMIRLDDGTWRVELSRVGRK